MTPQQKEIQILIGDLNRETQVLNNFLDAQTKRIQNINLERKKLKVISHG